MGTPLIKFDPSKTMYLRGFDGRGCSASLHDTSSTGCTISGYFSDLADFAVLMLYDADDLYGHLKINRYLPDFDLSNLVLDFDLAIVNCFNPISAKYPSVPWNALSWKLVDGTPGTIPLNITSKSGGVAASCQFTLSGTPTNYDRIQIVYSGNTVFDYMCDGTETLSTILNRASANSHGYVGLVKQINNATSATCPLTATSSGAVLTITCSLQGNDGNTIQLLSMYKITGNTDIAPALTYLTGGVDPTSIHISLDFNSILTTNVSLVRKLWLTIAPPLPLGQAFSSLEFSYTLSNISLSGSGNQNLKVVNRTSVVVGSQDIWCSYTGTWTLQSGFYYKGFAKSSSSGSVTIEYWSQDSGHSLYLGTVLGMGMGQFSANLDGINLSDCSCYTYDDNIITRRLLATGLSAGKHTLVLTVKLAICYFDYIQALIPSDPSDATSTNNHLSAALDFDTDQTYKLAPARNIWNLQQLGLLGNIDFYGGVFFALKRIRNDGSFSSAICTISATPTIGDDFFITVGGVAYGAEVGYLDTVDTIVQRLVNCINSTFVGIWASVTGTGQFTVTTFSPLNGFTFTISTTSSTVTFTMTGNLSVGTEGTWQIDSSQTTPLNRAFIDYLTDFSTLCVSAGLIFTLAWSQELLSPPDVDTSAGAWIQRFSDGSLALTGTFFSTLETVQCTFNPLTVTPYISAIYVQSAIIMSSAGIGQPILQFGEILHWFFSNGTSMAFYDANQKTAAQTVLGRALHTFVTSDDNPNVNSYTDANFLRARIQTHVHTIRTDVLASVSTAIFELLYPMDVNWPTAFQTSAYPYNLGGQLNHYINLPSDYFTPSSDIDVLKIECLAWGATYRTLDNVIAAIEYIIGLGWPLSKLSYLQPIFNGGCPIENEFDEALKLQIPNLNLFALDHLMLMSLDVPTG